MNNKESKNNKASHEEQKLIGEDVSGGDGAPDYVINRQ